MDVGLLGVLVYTLASVVGLSSAQIVTRRSSTGGYTALVPVNIRCVNNPKSGLTCSAEYPDQCKEQWNFPNQCTQANLSQNKTKFVHPFDTTKFLLCGELGKLYVVQCPQYEVYHAGCGQCVGESAGLTASCETPLPQVISNPCSREAILSNRLFFPFPSNITKFIHCDIWGKAWERICTPGEVWSQFDVACVNPILLNPCNKRTVDPKVMFPHPCDPFKYLRCGLQSDALEVTCDNGTAFFEPNQTCEPVEMFNGPLDNICGNFQFGFREYKGQIASLKVQQAIKNGLKAPKGMSSGQVSGLNVLSGMSGQINRMNVQTGLGSGQISGLNVQSEIISGQLNGLNSQSGMNSGSMVGLSGQSGMNSGQINGLSGQSEMNSGQINGLSGQSGMNSGQINGLSGQSGMISEQTNDINVPSGMNSAQMTILNVQSGIKEGQSSVLIRPKVNSGQGTGLGVQGTMSQTGIPVGVGQSMTGQGLIVDSINMLQNGNTMSTGLGMAADSKPSPSQTNINNVIEGGRQKDRLNEILNVWRQNVAMNGKGVSRLTDASAKVQNIGGMDMMGTSNTPQTMMSAKSVHPSLLREYEYSKEYFQEPCTAENLSNRRTHFRLKGDPHSFLQCDNNGRMFKMPCSTNKKDWFDVFTMTCVDGPVHVDNQVRRGMSSGPSMVMTQG